MMASPAPVHDTPPRAGAAALQDRRAHRDGAGGGEDRPAPGVEARMILEHAPGRLDGIESAPAAAQRAPARELRGLYAGAQLVAPVGRIGARAAVHDHRGRAAGVIAWWRHGHQRVTSALGSAKPVIILLTVPGPSNFIVTLAVAFAWCKDERASSAVSA